MTRTVAFLKFKYKGRLGQRQAALIAPIYTTPPGIIGGNTVGAVLTRVLGALVGIPTPTRSYQWFADGVAIVGETATTFTVTITQLGTHITVEETAVNALGTASSTSDPTDAIEGEITNEPPYYLGSTAAGTGDGSTLNNRAAFTGINGYIAAARALGGQIRIYAPSGIDVSSIINITQGGTVGNPVTIFGINASDVPTMTEIRGTRAANWVKGAATGADFLRLHAGANYLDFQYLRFKNTGTAVRITDNLNNVTFNHCEGRNVRRFLDCLVSGTGIVEASLSDFSIKNTTVLGFSKQAFRFQYDSRLGLIEDCVLDPLGQDGDSFCIGVHFEGSSNRITCRRVTSRNCIDIINNTGPSDYWNGDGFTSEGNTWSLTFDSCIATGSTDSGFDLKGGAAGAHTLVDCLSAYNKRSYRFWGTANLTRCIGHDPHNFGDIYSTSQVWVGYQPGVVTLTDCTFTDQNPVTSYVFNLYRSNSVLNLVNTAAQWHPNSELIHNDSSPPGTVNGTVLTTYPVNTGIPTVTGSAVYAQTLTAANGTWTGSGITYTYQWLKDGAYIDDATASTYVVALGDLDHHISVRVFATGSNGFGAEATSLETALVVGTLPEFTVDPTWSGLPVVGGTLFGTEGTVTGAPTPTRVYQWYKNGVVIAGATSLNYTIISGDFGSTLKLRDTATNIYGTDFAESVSTATIGSPVTQTLYLAVSTQGTGSGLSAANAFGGGLSSLPGLISGLAAGSTIRLLSHLVDGTQQDYVRTSSVTITSHGGATLANRLTIEGWNGQTGVLAKAQISSNRTSWTLPVDPNQVTNVTSWSDGSTILNLSSGVNNIHWRYLNFVRCGNGCFFFNNGANSGHKWDHIDFYNVKRFLDMSSGASLSDVGSGPNDPTFSVMTGTGYSECAFRIQGTSHHLVWGTPGTHGTYDCDFNSARQDGDNFAMGVQMYDSTSNLSFYRVRCRYSHEQVTAGSVNYWNGDGFTSDGLNYYLYMEDCDASGSTDAGYDLKAGDAGDPATWPTLVRCTATGNKANFKLWRPTVLVDCESTDARKYTIGGATGGTGSPIHIWCPATSTLSSIGKAYLTGGLLQGTGSAFVNDVDQNEIHAEGVEINTDSFFSQRGQLYITNCTGTTIPDYHPTYTVPTKVNVVRFTNSNSPSVGFTYPNHEAGDVIFMLLITDSNSGLAAPSGWTACGAAVNQGAWGSLLCWKRMDIQTYGSFTITVGAGASNLSRAVMAYVFDGLAAAGTPFEGYATNFGQSSTIVSPATVVAGADRRVVRIFAYGDDIGPGSLPAGYILEDAQTFGAGGGLGWAVDSKAAAAGTEASTSRTLATSQPYGTFGLALTPDVMSAPLVDLFLIGGQSNAEGLGNQPGGFGLPSNGYLYNGSTFSTLVDPVGNASPAGSAWPAFCQTWYSATGRKAVIRSVPTSLSGAWVKPGGSPTWDPATATIFTTAVNALNAAIVAVNANPLMTLNKVYVNWVQGESERGNIDAGTMTQGQYEGYLTGVFNGLIANVTQLDGIFVSELGRMQDNTLAAAGAAIRAAQANVCMAVQKAYLVWTGAKTLIDSQMRDNLHYGTSGLNAMGQGMAVGGAAVAPLSYLGFVRNDAPYPSNVWAMEKHPTENRVYVGTGNSSNNQPNINAGSGDLKYIDLDTNAIVTSPYLAAAINEEQIDKFKIIDGDLVFPGIDPRSGSPVYFHRLESGTWAKHQVGSDEHCFDIDKIGSTWVAARGTDNAGFWNVFSKSAATDGVGGWSDAQSSGGAHMGTRASLLFQHTGVQYATTLNIGGEPTIAQWDGSKFVSAPFTKAQVFPGGSTAFTQIRRAKPVGTSLVYIGAIDYNDSHWHPVGLYTATASFAATAKVALQTNELPWDLDVSGSTVYVLTSRLVSSGPQVFEIRVLSSVEPLGTWTEVLKFQQPTFARSFKKIGATSYLFGMGTDRSPTYEESGQPSYTDALKTASGSILRWG